MLNLIPIHDQNPTWRTAWVTIALIAINVVVFLLEPVAFSLSGDPSSPADACHQQAFFYRYAAIPKELTSNEQLPVTVADAPPRAAGNELQCRVTRPRYDKLPFLSVLYAMFLHGSWLHLLGNMLFLWVFGNNVEDRLGRVRYLLFYLLCGYAATYGFALADPGSTTTLVGASGAIAGVVLGSWFVLQYFYASGASIGTGAGVAYLAHVVGFIAGIVLIILLGGLSQRRRPPPTWQRWQTPYR